MEGENAAAVCQYRYDVLKKATSKWRQRLLYTGWWYLRKKGLLWTSRHALWSVKYYTSRMLAKKKLGSLGQARAEPQLRPHDQAGGAAPKPAPQARQTVPNEVLNLRPGELVEVRSAEEIMETLDADDKCRGLWFMPEMFRHCGKRYRVYKRLERMLLESTGEMRKLKNTVILEGVICDGSEHFDCDRSCFHYWREAWLKRVEKGEV